MSQKTGWIFVVLVALVATAALVYAQDAGRTPAAQQSRSGSEQAGPETRGVEWIASVLAENQQALGLTDAQVERLARALAAAQARGHHGDDHADHHHSHHGHRHGHDWCDRDHSDHGRRQDWHCH